MEKVSEMTTEPIVGKFYLVACALENLSQKWWPIIPNWHHDKELGIADEHYHFDVRFFADNDLYHKRTGYEPEVAQMGAIVRVADYGFAGVTIPSEGFAWKRRKCRRRMPVMPPVLQYRNIETKLLGSKVLCGKCPHRGMPLESLPKNDDGTVICNGHGLKIDMNKREVVKR